VVYVDYDSSQCNCIEKETAIQEKIRKQYPYFTFICYNKLKGKKCKKGGFKK